jgi:hypothetical protein
MKRQWPAFILGFWSYRYRHPSPTPKQRAQRRLWGQKFVKGPSRRLHARNKSSARWFAFGMSLGEVGGGDRCVPGTLGPDASVGRLIGAWQKVSTDRCSVGGEMAGEGVRTAHPAVGA